MKNFYKNKHFAIFQNSFCDWETGELLSPIQTQNYTVLQVAELHYNNAFIIKKHLQRCDLELIFPMTNGLFCSINGKEEKVYKHEIHLSFKGDKHEISSRIGCRFQSLAINFTPESENLLTSLRQSSTISRKKYIPDLAPYFKSIITEFLSTEQPFFLQSLDSLITSVLVGLARGDKALSSPFFSLTAPDLHNYIDDNFLDICSLDELSSQFGYTYGHICKLFKKEYNTTPVKYLLKKKMDYVLSLLSQGKTLTEIAETTGYSTPYNLSRAFKTHFGYSPSDFKKKEHLLSPKTE